MICICEMKRDESSSLKKVHSRETVTKITRTKSSHVRSNEASSPGNDPLSRTQRRTQVQFQTSQEWSLPIADDSARFYSIPKPHGSKLP